MFNTIYVTIKKRTFRSPVMINNVINMNFNSFYVIVIFVSKYRRNSFNRNTFPYFVIVRLFCFRTFTNEFIVSIAMGTITKFTNFHSVKGGRIGIARNIGEIITRRTIATCN